MTRASLSKFSQVPPLGGNPELREEFYETIESIIDKTPKRDAIILAGDFNAKTGSGWNEFRENIGKYGKGLINSSGRRLLEMCKKITCTSQIQRLSIRKVIEQHGLPRTEVSKQGRRDVGVWGV